MNLFERINRHLEGRGGEWTRKHKPIRLIHFEEYATQEEAVKREKHFKSGSGREWLEQIKAEREKENEPASELLKRIAAEKAELVKAKKIRKHPPAGRAGKPLPPITDDDLPAGKAGPLSICLEWLPAGLLCGVWIAGLTVFSSRLPGLEWFVSSSGDGREERVVDLWVAGLQAD